MNPPDRVETERLVLRKPALTDAPEIYQRYASDPEVTRFLGWARHRSIDDTRSFLQFSAALWRDSPPGPYLIEAKSGRLLGSTGLEVKSAREAATGYVLARDAWGHGYATEALQSMIDLARRLHFHKLQALCHVEHEVSQHILEKCGFRFTVQLAVDFPNLPAC